MTNKLKQIILAWSSFCITLWGWRKITLSIFLGGLSVLALPPINLFFILFITMPSLIWLLDGAVNTSFKQQTNADTNILKRLWSKINSVKPAFWIGLSFGFGYFFFGLLWIGEAFLVEASKHVYLLPFAVGILPLILAVFWGLACLTARLFWSTPLKNVIIFSISMLFWEFLRGHVFTGFPWNLLGFAFDFSTAMLQSASIWGIYGLTFIAIFITSAGSLIVNERYKMRHIVIGICCLLMVVWGLGSIRLYMNPTQYHDDVLLRLVQGNIKQANKWKPEMRAIIANRYLELSALKTTNKENKAQKITHIIWPESAMPFLLEADSSFVREIKGLLDTNTFLLAGAIRKHQKTNQNLFFNSVLAFDSNGNRVGKYDKHHLVPFGEYVPLSNLLKKIGINKLISMKEDFSVGSNPRNIYLKNTPSFATNICFEIIFSAQVVERKTRPEWILNVTNDAWFGETIGPYQHLAQARMRAIEEGLPMVRIANTGLTAIFDSLGRKIAYLPKGKAAVLDSPLPLKVEPTWFVIFTSFM